MTEILSLNGDPQDLLRMLFGIISDTNTDPLYHISEITQNEMDADATYITIEFVRQSGRKGTLKKIIISGDGWGFLESFEHYGKNIGSSIKKHIKEYLERQAKGQSRGEFCIGLQGFRAICEEIQVVNLTKPGMKPKSDSETEIVDENFSKMFTNRKLIIKAESLDATIQGADEFNDTRDNYGVTCSLLYPKVDIKAKNLVKYLSQNKRAELLANRNLKIIVKEGTFETQVKPINYTGEKVEYLIDHPKAKKNYKYRAFGPIKATLYFHEEKSGSKVRLDVNKEPILFDITLLEEFNIPPWNTGCVEGIIEDDRLKKSPLRSGVERDEFYHGFVEIMEVLSKQVNKKVKEYLEKTKSKQDVETMKKMNQVYGDLKRELEFNTWFKKKVEKPQPGPLEDIQVFPELANVPAHTTRRVHVRAYDNQGKALNESNDIQFDWMVSNDLGSISPRKNGEAIFKASSKIGPTSIVVTVSDLITQKELTGNIKVAITLPHKVGPLARVKIEPTVVTLPLGEEKEFRAIAEDDEHNIITDKSVKYSWSILVDETSGATLNNNYSESVILTSGKNQGTIKIQVTASQWSQQAIDNAWITVVERRKKTERKPPKPKGSGLPILAYEKGLEGFDIIHSKLSDDGSILYCYDNHPDYINAKARGKKYRQRYVATLYAKELAKKEHEATSKDYGELLLDVLSKIDRFW